MQIAKSATCQTFTASRRDNGTLIVVEKIELHCTMETGRQLQSAISKIGNGESRNGEPGNGERGISKIGNI